MNLRKISIEILYEVYHKNKALKDVFKSKIKSLDTRDIFLIKNYSYGVVRNSILIDFILNKIAVHKNSTNKFVWIIFKLAIFELFILKEKDFTVVNEACKLSKIFNLNYATGFLNQRLRFFLKQKISIHDLKKEDVCKYISVKYSYHIDLVMYLVRLFGVKNTLKFCIFGNREPKLFCKILDKKFFDDFAGKVVKSKIFDDSFCISGIKNLDNLQSFRNGYFFIQDEPSQIVSLISASKKNELILDACAGPGGKLSAFLNSDANVVAVEISKLKCKKIEENIERLKLKKCRIENIDFLNFDFSEKFDKILLDAPCSGLGVINKYPESKILKDFEKYKNLQIRMVEKAYSLLKNKGLLIYSVCTISKEETDEVVNSFLLDKKFELVDIKSILDISFYKFIDNSIMKILPFMHNMNSFYCAVLRKV